MESAKTDDERNRLKLNLADAQNALYESYRDARAASPVYRSLLSVGAGPLRLSQLQRTLAAGDGLVLIYWLGEKASYVLAITSDNAQLTQLSLDDSLAKALGLKAGAIIASDFRDVLTGPAHPDATNAVASKANEPANSRGISIDPGTSGVLQLISSRNNLEPPAEKLNALWNLLIPQAQRDAILAGKMKRLIIVPDGALALLPFEALVVDSSSNPQYLLDCGPPILYGPSATVLYNLLQRRTPSANTGNNSLLTVGDPVYGGVKERSSAPADQLLARAGMTTSERYGSLGGPLRNLPNTAIEAGWVADAFSAIGYHADKLLKADATEANVRRNISGKQIVHLACHGLVDAEHGNFFGALALTPGPKGNSDPTDDGFLTLPEVYDLDLKACDLAILSACQTNYGPQQRGEGVWALLRGFLVAGARRVVASNWLVDDEAAANLVYAFSTKIAQQKKSNDAIDYAQALRDAKLWARKQDKWQRPYYWATFTLIGPM